MIKIINLNFDFFFYYKSNILEDVVIPIFIPIHLDSDFNFDFVC